MQAGSTPLMQAVEGGHLHHVLALLEHGAELELQDQVGKRDSRH